MAGFDGSLHADSAGPVIVGDWVGWEGLIVVTLNPVVGGGSCSVLLANGAVKSPIRDVC